MAKPTKPGGVPKKRPAKATKAAPAAVAVAASGSTRGGGGRRAYEVICSECYTEFEFAARPATNKLACPECMHVGQVADADAMMKIEASKRGEQSALMLAIFPALLLLACGLGWCAYLFSIGAGKTDANVNYAFAICTFLLLATTLFFGVKYESRRYEVYF